MTFSRRNLQHILGFTADFTAGFTAVAKVVATVGLTVLASWLGSSVQAQGVVTTGVEITAYSSSSSQTDDAPTITASGAVAGPGTVAVSRDLLKRFPYGSAVEIIAVSGEGCGGWVPETPLTVADTMNARLKNHLDIWLGTTEQALNWGRCQGEIRPVK